MRAECGKDAASGMIRRACNHLCCFALHGEVSSPMSHSRGLGGIMGSPPAMADLLRFGTFELDSRAGQLRNKGRTVRMAPLPFKLLSLLTSTPGRLVTREEIRTALWDGDTFIDFEQSVNFTVKQVREALNDNADRALYIETVPKRGYRFIAPVDDGKPAAIHAQGGTDGTMAKLLWTNVAELRMQEQQRKARQRTVAIAAGITAALVVAAAVIFWFVR
jgi:DNA-binding winged helix-turn-helix (wHTH) protein